MKNKIMLINPFFKEGLKGFPLGLAYIAGALRNYFEVCALDLTARAAVENRDPNIILNEELERQLPDIVGITSTSPTHLEALEAAKTVKGFGDIAVIKGGPHETNCAETTIRNNKAVDYSVVGEGEETIVELIGRIFERQGIKGLQGVVFREGNKVINNGRRALIRDLDTLPRPARDLFYLDKRFDSYYSASLFEGRKSTSIMASRGCPYSCFFCSSRVNWGNIRQRSVGNVLEEVEGLYAQGFRGFMFEDDMSLLNRKWFLDFAEKLRQKVLDAWYSLQTRVDAIDGEIAKALSSSGCRYIYFGIESGVQDILDKCGKGIDISQAKKAFEIARACGIRNMASIQFGLPGEDLETLSTVRETIRVLNEELKPDEAAISYTSLYPGSPLAVREGITPEMYEEYAKSILDGEIYPKIAHGTHAIHPRQMTDEKIMEIEKVLEKELRIKRFETDTLYKR